MDQSGAMRTRGTTPTALGALLVIGFLVAAGATALVVLADDVRMLRLAAVLALWAALIAAFAVTRSRRDTKAALMRGNEAHLSYKVELQREVSARHEYEAGLAVQMASKQSTQIAELREQLDRLTEVLSSLADGELLVSRMTLSAQSARFRTGQSVLPEAEARAALIGNAARELTWSTDMYADTYADIDIDGQVARVPEPVPPVPEPLSEPEPALPVPEPLSEPEWPLITAAPEPEHTSLEPISRPMPMAPDVSLAEVQQPESAPRRSRHAAPEDSAPEDSAPADAAPEDSAPADAAHEGPEREATESNDVAPVLAAEPKIAELPAPEPPTAAPPIPQVAGPEPSASVDDLLAAYGLSPSNRRRRRD
ncbi:MAG: DUF6779 domain-containing protein [Nakamurella sp.]